MILVIGIELTKRGEETNRTIDRTNSSRENLRRVLAIRSDKEKLQRSKSLVTEREFNYRKGRERLGNVRIDRARA